MTSTESGTETIDRHELMFGIREAIGIRTSGTAATIATTRTRRIVATLEFMSDEELRLLLPLAQHARQLSLTEPGSHRNKLTGVIEDNEPFTGEDCYYLQDTLYSGKTGDIMMLARALNVLPPTMPLRAVVGTLNNVSHEMFPLDTPEQIAAHIAVSEELSETRSYSPQAMLLVSTHPDKVKTIIGLIKQHERIPTHREVMMHHGVEPVLFDGVL